MAIFTQQEDALVHILTHEGPIGLRVIGWDGGTITGTITSDHQVAVEFVNGLFSDRATRAGWRRLKICKFRLSAVP